MTWFIYEQRDLFSNCIFHEYPTKERMLKALDEIENEYKDDQKRMLFGYNRLIYGEIQGERK